MRKSKQNRMKERGGLKKKGRRKWLLRDQPCVRLASGDINTTDAARATILLFTAGEADKRTLTKGKRERAGEGWLASTPLRPTAPFTGTAPPDESKNKEVDVLFPTALVSRRH